MQGNNYGATLQAVALNKKLNSLGFDTENLDYNDKKRVFRSLSAVGKIKYFLRQKIVVPLLIGGAKKKKFAAFRARYLKRSAQKWNSKEALLKNPPDYDVYISGSDQIWNPDVIRDDYNYLLAFAPDDKKKSAYASSFGKGKLPKSKEEIYRRYLKRFDAIGVREESGRKLVEGLIQKECKTVLDPTLLLSKEEWAELAAETTEKEPYVLCYYMPGDEVVCRAIEEIAKRIARERGLKIINLGLKEYYSLKRGIDFRAKAGPEDFVGLFLHADYVVTNSFHGTAFSTNFNKQVYVPINASLDKEKSRHTRMVDYLNLIGLEQALVFVDEKEVSFSFDPLNYENASKAIEDKRNESIAFLLQTINS